MTYSPARLRALSASINGHFKRLIGMVSRDPAPVRGACAICTYRGPLDSAGLCPSCAADMAADRSESRDDCKHER